MSYINKDFFENAENQQKAMQINWEIADCLHQFGKLPCNGFPLVPYLLHKASQYSNPFGITLQQSPMVRLKSTKMFALWQKRF